jgi:hypothetical protein
VTYEEFGRLKRSFIDAYAEATQVGYDFAEVKMLELLSRARSMVYDDLEMMLETNGICWIHKGVEGRGFRG